MGFRFKKEEMESIDDLFDRLIQPANPRQEDQTEDQAEEKASIYLSQDFIRKYTSFDSFEEFSLQAPLPLQAADQLNEGDSYLMNQFVRQHSDFESWQELLNHR
ncbi:MULTISPECIES: hypothetical protein [Aerococcus]|uniref:hypothetical protein n=1 Tax=Aerococcus TaxID=1375 RepID=UPI000200E53C|nr:MULTISPECIES: hypothetical protein [Aerococcus]AEA01818.1 hypothetical protein HMPREF9243_1191 [Aerococcus sp. Group 1]MCY3031000.1 hypothetical protein [Aerococcus sp. Group 1]MCY3055533.1 hypothetical protein [Aerococcus sp. Group 1]MCY3057263.1 hypothetical protein [Aerococcus sp. Group 1]MCY3061367.1 hypothetical protein [Aerococcus sp. Group 1]